MARMKVFGQRSTNTNDIVNLLILATRRGCIHNESKAHLVGHIPSGPCLLADACYDIQADMIEQTSSLGSTYSTDSVRD